MVKIEDKNEKKAFESLKKAYKLKITEFRITDGHVTSLNLPPKGMTALPESIGNLKLLQIPY